MAHRIEEPWQVSCSKIHNRASYVLNERKWTDCTFHFDTGDAGAEAGGSKESLQAHKLILAMASPVFEAMFYGNVGDQENSVNIVDIDWSIFAALLQYVYTDDTNIPDARTAIDLFKAANKYMVVDLEGRM
ncbi:BTB/POZ domain-containing protein [Phthorimaea operculella]|nr:BTB/POZ domain-containing protein [Phthorimaea operculella]